MAKGQIFYILFQKDEIWNIIAIVIEHIGYKKTLRKHISASVKIADKVACLSPPGNVWIHVGTGEVFISGEAEFFWRRGKGMPYNSIYARAKNTVDIAL